MESKTQGKDVFFEFDKYVPCSMYFYDKLLSDLYWRAGNGNTSLIEVGILNNGLLNSITVVSISADHVIKREDSYLIESRIEKGLPIFNTLSWEKNLEDYKNVFLDNFSINFNFIVGINYIEIKFSMEVVDFYLKNQGVFLGFNKRNFLVRVLIVEVDENIISMLKFFY
ncbi:hypothetical protein [Acinetobacter colistiniresistens]|nr:hypothetical protein [Acinetobacter colistiniresistens]